MKEFVDALMKCGCDYDLIAGGSRIVITWVEGKHLLLGICIIEEGKDNNGMPLKSELWETFSLIPRDPSDIVNGR